jgi:PEP-CTERM motif
MAKTLYLALGALALGVGYASTASSATININASLTNPSFENGTSGWTVSNSAGAYTVTSAQYTPGSDGLSGGLVVPDGTHAADMPTGVSGNGSLSQTTNLTFQAGNTYTFVFWVGQPKTGTDGQTPVVGFPNTTVSLLTNGVTDNLGGNGNATLTPLTGSGTTQNINSSCGSCAVVFALASPGSGQWQEWQLTYVDQFVNSGLVGIQLSDLNATNNQGVNFDIAATPGVPEPATWGMMLLGFVGLGFAFRQSRRKISLA